MREELDERFAGGELDLDVWFPYYLPHWSSRAASAATWDVRGGELRLTIPPDQPLWCPDVHPEPLRVSCVQTACVTGQQPFADGLVVREEQPAFRGYTRSLSSGTAIRRSSPARRSTTAPFRRRASRWSATHAMTRSPTTWPTVRPGS